MCYSQFTAHSTLTKLKFNKARLSDKKNYCGGHHSYKKNFVACRDCKRRDEYYRYYYIMSGVMDVRTIVGHGVYCRKF
jgi:hypothetical protein